MELRGYSHLAGLDRRFEFSLLGMLTGGYLAVLGSGFLDLPTAVVAASALLIRALLSAGVWRVSIPQSWATFTALAYIAFYPIDYFFLSNDFLAASAHLVFFLVVVRVVTAASPQHYDSLLVIALLELLLGALVSNNVTFFVGLALFLPCGVIALVLRELRASAAEFEHRPTGSRTFPASGVRRAVIVITALVLVGGAVLFFLLPRTARAALRQFGHGGYHLAGFSNEVNLGDIGEIQQTGETVLRVQFFNHDVPRDLKWRGLALRSFDGHKWFNPEERPEMLRVYDGMVRLSSSTPWRNRGRRIGYEVRTQQTGTPALFFAGVPELVRLEAPFIGRTATGSYRVGYGSSDGMRYSAYSFLPDWSTDVPHEDLSPAEARPYLELPLRVDRRIGDLARSVTAGHSSAEARARAIENHLRNNYGYTLELLEAPVKDPLAYFLFVRREGHCEYFASAMAVMLREIGIPSRIVNGFQSGEFNPLSGWQVIRTSDAHSWVEAWIEGKGWMTFDPTPVGQASSELAWISRIRLYRDAMETFWQEWILDYNLERQFFLVARVGSGNLFRGDEEDAWAAAWQRFRADAQAALEQWGAIAAGLAAAAGLLLWLGLRRRLWPGLEGWLRSMMRRPADRTPETTRAYLRMLAILERRGFRKPPWVTPAEFAATFNDSETGRVVREITAAYNRQRFGGVPPSSEIWGLLQQLKSARKAH